MRMRSIGASVVAGAVAYLAVVACGSMGVDAVGGPSAAQAASEGSRLKVRTFHGEDGSKMEQGLWDSSRQELCAFRATGEAEYRCLPQNSEMVDPAAANSFSVFTDPDCRTAYTGLVVKPAKQCDGARYYLAQPSCGPGVTAAYVSDPSVAYYTKEDGACRAGTPRYASYVIVPVTKVELTEFVRAESK